MSHSESVKSASAPDGVTSPEDDWGDLLDFEEDDVPGGGVAAASLELASVDKTTYNTLEDTSDSSESSTGSKGVERNFNAKEYLEEEDELQDIPFVPPPAIPIPSQSVAKKRTCVHPPPKPRNVPPNPARMLLHSNRKMFGELKFMADFDPSNSSRNQQKKKKRYHHVDGRIVQYADDFDDCDCLRSNCVGCHFPCGNCGDSRCGHECRVNRRWLYESVEIEGADEEIKNPHANSFS